MKKEQVIRPVDAKEYINFQFQGLAETLDRFDYPGMASVIRATCSVFNKTNPESHVTHPDCVLIEKQHLK